MQNALTGGFGLLCEVLDRDARCVGPEHALLCLLLLPDPTPSGRGCFAAGFVHRLHLLVTLRQREGLLEIERVLHLAGRVVLRLEEGIEVPVGLLDDPAVEFGKSHLEKDLPHLGDDPLVGMDLPGPGLLRQFLYVILAEVRRSSTRPRGSGRG